MPIMDSLSKFAKSVGDGAKTAVKKSEDMVEVAKLNKSISNEEDRIKLTFSEMGNIVYSKYEKGEVVEEELIQFCSKIDDIYKNISSLKEKIADIKNVRICSKCGAEFEPASEFCVKCGTKQEYTPMENHEVKDDVMIEEDKDEIAKKPCFCPSCGKEITQDSKFCQECGAKLD